MPPDGPGREGNPMRIDRSFRDCGQGAACPAAHPTDTARWIMQGPKVDPATQPGIVVPFHEGLVEVTPDVVDMIRRQPYMDIPQLGDWITAHHQQDSFRLQTLARYTVESDEPDFRAYLAGASKPDPAVKAGWLDWLRDVRDTGRTWRNLHIITEWTPYLSYLCEWCYVDNTAAGADNRIVDLREVASPVNLADIDDFYFVDGHAAVVAYDRDGHYLYALPVDHPDRLAETRDLLWDAASPFHEWWARHPEHRRASRRAA